MYAQEYEPYPRKRPFLVPLCAGRYKSYKDLLPELGLPDDLNKRLDELLTIEKERERKGEGTFGPGFKDLNAARKKFRHAYRKIRKHSPSKLVAKEKKSDSEDDFDLNMSSSESEDSDLVNITDPDEDAMKRLPAVLTKEQEEKLTKENGHLKYLENKYLEKKVLLEKALKELEEDDKVDEDLLRSITSELDLEMEDYDFQQEDEELNRIISELKEMTKDMPPDIGKFEQIPD